MGTTYGTTTTTPANELGALSMIREAIERAEILCKTVDELNKKMADYLPPAVQTDVEGITPPDQSRPEALIEIARLTGLINRAISELCIISGRAQL